MVPFTCRVVVVGSSFQVVPSKIPEFNAPFCLAETRRYFNRCDLFHSFHAIVEVQFRELTRLDTTVNNYKDNLNFLYHHADMMLTMELVLRNIIVCAYLHYFDSWAMNGAYVGHCAILMHSMLMFAMHSGHYWHHEHHFIKKCKRKKIPTSMPMPVIDVEALLTDKEENLKLEQIRTTLPGILDLLGDPGNLLCGEPLSMMEHFNATVVGAQHFGELPKHGQCKDLEMIARVYQDEARQVCQKILGCLDMRVLDANIIVPICLHMPTLILPHRRFLHLYFNPDNQGHHASKFLSRGQGFLQPRETFGHQSSLKILGCCLPMCENALMPTFIGKN